MEADRFAGSFARAVHDHAYGDDGWFEEMRNRAERKEVFETAQKVYGPMLPSETHPPAKERIAAFEAGYAPAGKRRLVTAHVDSCRSQFARPGMPMR